MKKILLMDTLSTIHVGNGALLENTISFCKEAFGECSFNIITMDRETNSLKYDSNILYEPIFGDFWRNKDRFAKLIWAFKNIFFIFVHLLNEKTLRINSLKITFNKAQREAIKTIEESDICISCGGEIINDTFYQALPFWLFSYWLAIKKKKKFILFPQSVGPLRKKWTRFLTYHSLKEATLYAGRDNSSYETLLSLGFNKRNVLFVPDVAINQKPDNFNINKYFKNSDGFKKKNIGITVSNPPFSELGEKVNFIEEIGNQLEELKTNKYKILIMPSNYKLNDISDDYRECLDLKKKLSIKFEVAILENRPYFPGEYSSLLTQLDFFISTRMHVAILATSVFTPTIAVNTQHKIMGYMKNIDMEKFCLKYEQLTSIKELINEIECNREKIVCDLKRANNKLKMEQKVFKKRLREIVND